MISVKVNEEKRKTINDLANQHQDYLIAEQEAAKKLGTPLPDPAQPQGAMQ